MTAIPADRPMKIVKPKGLLVEDRNAAVRTDESGEQRIVKVPDRKEEAARQGVDESQI